MSLEERVKDQRIAAARARRLIRMLPLFGPGLVTGGFALVVISWFRAPG
jgi:hypothetical protein